jgi:hypothetical protein
MAIIISYPSAGTVTTSDNLLGTQFDAESGANITKNFSVGSIIALANAQSILGTTNYLSKFAGASTLDNSQIYQSGTNISIGGTTAAAKLDVQGDIFVRNSVYFGQLAGSVVPEWSLTVNSFGDLVVDDSIGTENFIFSNTGNVFFSNAGQVTIGTTVVGTPAYGLLPQLTVASASGGVLDIRTNELNVVANTSLGRIQFTGEGYTSAVIETISFTSPGSGSNGGGILKLMTSDTGTGAIPIERMRITQSGIVQPGLDNAYSLGASGIRWSAVWAANGTIQTSDEREKKNIVDADLGLDFVSKLRPVSFKWKIGKNEITSELDGVDKEGNIKSKTIVTPIEGKRTHYGLIAQEVEALLDGKDFGGFIHDEETDIKGLRYDQFIPILINAIKELNAKIDALELQIVELKTK